MTSTTLQKLMEKYPNKPWNLKKGNITYREVVLNKILPNGEENLSEYIEKKVNEYINNNKDKARRILNGTAWNCVHERQYFAGFHWTSLSYVVDPNFVDANPTYPWNFYEHLSLSGNSSITLDFIERHIEENWNWGWVLGKNPVITPEFVEKHIDKEWRWGSYGFSENPSITPEFIERHLDEDWWWGKYGLSENPSITPEFVERHLNIGGYNSKYSKPKYEWCLLSLCENPGITLEFIEKYLLSEEAFNRYRERNDNNCWKYLSKNPNLTFEFIDSHHDKPWEWGPEGLSHNLFENHPVLIKRLKKEHEKRVKERVAFISCKKNINLPLDIVRYITNFV
jgi:hypothetical protein